jgi:transposase, IS30 family
MRMRYLRRRQQRSLEPAPRRRAVGREGNKDQVTRAATRAIRRHCRQFKTLTLDNGTEFHDYAVLEQRFPVKVYFATPYHSWERGSNENFNGLVRQYLPKGACMSKVTQAQCNHIADDLNHRPRKRFGFNTPAKLYHRN